VIYLNCTMMHGLTNLKYKLFAVCRMGSEASKNKIGKVTDHCTTHRDVFAVRVTIVTVETQQCVLRVVEMHINYQLHKR